MGYQYHAIAEIFDSENCKWQHICDFGFLDRNKVAEWFMLLPQNGFPDDMSWKGMLQVYIQAKWLCGDETIIKQNTRPDIILIEDDEIGPCGYTMSVGMMSWPSDKLPPELQFIKCALIGLRMNYDARMIWWIP